MQLFGLSITLGKKDKEKNNILSVVPPAADDGSAIISSINAGSYYGMVLDVEGVIKNENDLIRRYREVAQYPDCDSAIEDIINEAIMAEDGKQPVEIILDDLKLSESIKKKIAEEFKIVLQLLKIDDRGHDMFRTWYIDGRLYYHVMIDENNIKDGIVEMRAIDPRKIRRIKNVIRERQPGTNVEVVKKIDEYYLFNDKGITEQTTAGVKLSLDSVVYTPSGLVDANTGMMLSFLHKAIKPVNQLKLIEDSLVIYRVSRAPERRIFYIDVGNLPKIKAEQYVNDVMNRFRNKVVYDASTGETRDDRKFMSMLEDFWMPRREGSKGTEITTLPGGCFAMDTKVSLLDGRELSIRDIESEMSQGKTLWTYSCDEFTGEVKPGLISWAGVTQKSAKVMKLTLDSGEEIICTPDHKFPIYGKGFVEAKDFVEGESLIPLYRKKEFISEHKKLDYETLFDNATKKWKYTHRMVKSHIDLPLEIHEEDFEDGYVVHHKNVNRHDNSPENLCLMSWRDHSRYHRSIAFPPMVGTIASVAKMKMEREKNSDWYKNKSKKSSDNSKKFWNGLSEVEYNKICAKVQSGVQSFIDNQSDEERAIRAINSNKALRLGTAAFVKKLETDVEFAKYISDIRKLSWTDTRRETASIRQSTISKDIWSNVELSESRRENHKKVQEVEFDNVILCSIIDIVRGKTTHQVTIHDVVDSLNSNKHCVDRLLELNCNKCIPNLDISVGFTKGLVDKCVTRFGKYDSWKDFRVKESLHNHRVVRIEYLADEIEVGTLTIDSNELVHNHHTFALSCGIFTKNSNLGQIDDIVYFQNKLFQALNVPIGRLKPDQVFSLGKSSEITREEVKFSKFIGRLRKRFSTLFKDTLRVQLVSKGIIRPDEWDDMRSLIRFDFVKDNYFSELKDNEILNQRMNMLQMIDPYVGKYYSTTWIRKHVLQQSEEDIKDIDTEMKDEQAMLAANTATPEEIPQEQQGEGK